MNDEVLRSGLAALADTGGSAGAGTVLAGARSRVVRRAQRRRIGFGTSAAAVALTCVLALAVAVTGSGDEVAFRTAPGPAVVPDDAVAFHLELDQDWVISGGELTGRLVVTNTTEDAVRFATGECGMPWAVALARPGEDPRFSFDLACREALVIEPGESTLPVRVPASHSSCLGPEGESTDPDILRCEPGGGVPGLEPGEYEAVLVPLDLGDSLDPPGVFLPPEPVPVTVVTEDELFERTRDVTDPGPLVVEVTGYDAEFLDLIERSVPEGYVLLAARTYVSQDGTVGSEADFQRDDGTASLKVTWQYLPEQRLTNPDGTRIEIAPEGDATLIPMGDTSDRALFVRQDGFQVGVQSSALLTPDWERYAVESKLEPPVIERLARELASAYAG